MVELKRFEHSIYTFSTLLIIAVILFTTTLIIYFIKSFSTIKSEILNITQDNSFILSKLTEFQTISLLQIIVYSIALILSLFGIIKLSRIYFNMRKKAFIDPLTGIYNKRGLEKILNQEISRAKRFKHNLSIVMLDIDYFKKYNDTNGHVAGDKLLTKFSKLLQSELRDIDNVARYGGEEFIIILPRSSHKEAEKISERIRKKIGSTKFKGGKSQPLRKVTASFGLATFSKPSQSHHSLINSADELLYQAKLAGRNVLKKRHFENHH